MFSSPFKSPFQNPFPTEGAAAAAATYAEVWRDTYSASEIWPLVDIASGTNIPAFIASARDGTLTGWDLQNAAGPVTGTLAPYSDGANDYGNILTSNGSTGLADIWNQDAGKLGSLSIYLNPDGRDNVDRRLLWIVGNNTQNFILVYQQNSSQFRFWYRANNVNYIITYVSSSSDEVMLSMTWDYANQKFIGYANGVEVGTRITSFNEWAATTLTQANIGSGANPPSNVTKGWPSYLVFKLGSTVWTPTQISNAYADRLTAGPD